MRFLADVAAGETAWEPIGRFVRRYLRAFRAEDTVLLTLRLGEGCDAATIGRRIERLLASVDLSSDLCADIEVVDADDELDVVERTVRITELPNLRPSALRLMIEKEQP